VVGDLSVQTVTVDVTRTDLTYFQIRLLLVHPLNRFVFIAVFLFCSGLTLMGSSQVGGLEIVSAILTGLVSVAGAFAFCIVLVTGWVWLAPRSHRGSLGERTFTLTTDGLHEKSASGDWTVNWGGATSLFRSGRLIYVGINASLYHLIPRRYFSDASADQSFWNSLQKLKAVKP
jgi:hypothetical protein